MDLLRPKPASSSYWEARARRFATVGAGLKAVCSYGMPRFYNAAIERNQRRALDPWLAVTAGERVLDVGCGVGRWSRLLARRGARVTGVDLAPTMIVEARRRAREEGVGERCRFEVQDVARLELGETYSRILAVTVLQHVLEPETLAAAAGRMARHLAPGGRLVLLEAAPSSGSRRCNSAVFAARSLAAYRQLFSAAGLAVETVTGVDPAPFKIWFLPYYHRLPQPLALACLLLVTSLSWPIDELFGRRAVSASWHKVLVLRHQRLPVDKGR